MVVWKEALYVAGIPEKRQKRIMKAIGKRRPVKDVYLLTAPSNEANCLEYVKANQLLQPYYRKKEITVYGLAGSEGAAQELAASMLCETYMATGDFQVISHLEKKSGKAGDDS
ncbi:MAG: hypothetical protein IKT67_07540 [Lachnospiraceae bacterium]|nr:hypothetical protein [Lachnospiraceae bacterium]